MVDRDVTRLCDDPFLAPYAECLRARSEWAKRRIADLAEDGVSLSRFAGAHEYYGLHRADGGGWVFREWAPNAKEIWLVGDFSNWEKNPRFKLERLPGRDVWEGRFPFRSIRHGQFYRLEMVWEGGSGERIPAYARRVVQDENTKLFSAQVWNVKKPYVWKNKTPEVPATSLIYEAHVGMAQEDARVGTYEEFRKFTLPRIKKAGYNTIQLMAVMEHPYYGSFGYHVSSFFAASSRFGTPEELKALIDDAHGMGLRVIMDIVHSHSVKNERDGLSLFDGTPYQYFHAGPRGNHEAWDSRCFDYGKTDVLHFLLSNCRFWLDEYRFDGFRFDGVTSMLYRNHGLGVDFGDYGMYFGDGVDEDAFVYLALANKLIHEVRGDAVTVAEDVSGMPGCASPVEDGGLGFDFRMAMGVPDYWFKLAAGTQDENWPMGYLYYVLNDHRKDEKTVSYVESHDQALVGGKTFIFTLADDAMYDAMDRASGDLRVDRATAIHKMARLATLGTSDGAYLNFMGNEFGHPEWIDFPREGNNWSYAHARRMWRLRDNGFLFYKCLGDFDEAMMRLFAKTKVLDTHAPIRLLDNDGDKTLAFMRGRLVFVFNFNPVKSFTDYGVAVPPGAYRRILDTDEPRFGGHGRIKARQEFSTYPVIAGNQRIDYVNLYLPARSAIVLERKKGERKK